MQKIEFAFNKKRYVKPDAQLIDFSLSSSIAGACVSGGSAADNGWYIMSDTCNMPTIGSGDPEFCYGVPTADSSVFLS